MRAGRTPQRASRLTLRVSRDNGQTYGQPVTAAVEHPPPSITAGELLAIDCLTGTWPPCQCPQHRAGESRA